MLLEILKCAAIPVVVLLVGFVMASLMYVMGPLSLIFLFVVFVTALIYYIRNGWSLPK